MPSEQQKQQKAEKRAAALRDNLKKRKAFIKETVISNKEKQNDKS